MPLFSHSDSACPVVVGEPIEEVPDGAPALAPEDGVLDRDLAELLALGLRLEDVERLWQRQNAEVAPESVVAAGARLMGSHGLPVRRQVTVGLEIAAKASEFDDVLPELAALLQAELDDPPERYKDPIMLAIMSDPVVLSSGHIFDRSTVVDKDTGRFRFQHCPLTREPVEQRAFPLKSLRSELIEFKLRRLGGILKVLIA
jgi:hypothetical protein